MSYGLKTMYSQRVMTLFGLRHFHHTKHSTESLLEVPDRRWVLGGHSDPVLRELLVLPAESTEQL